MLSSKISGLFKKILRQPEDQLLDCSSESCRNSLIGCNHSVCDSNSVKSMGGHGACVGGRVQWVGGECNPFTAIERSEMAAYPVECTGSTYLSGSVFSSSEGSTTSDPNLPVPLCCCEMCAWWLDSYPHLCHESSLQQLYSICNLAPTYQPSAELSSSSRSTQTSTHTCTVTSTHTSTPTSALTSTQTSTPITRSRTREASEKRSSRVSSNKATSVLTDSKLSENSEESTSTTDSTRLPVSVIRSLDGEENYNTTKRQISYSNRLRRDVTSYNYEVGHGMMQAPPNKSICHVIR